MTAQTIISLLEQALKNAMHDIYMCVRAFLLMQYFLFI